MLRRRINTFVVSQASSLCLQAAHCMSSAPGGNSASPLASPSSIHTPASSRGSAPASPSSMAQTSFTSGYVSAATQFPAAPLIGSTSAPHQHFEEQGGKVPPFAAAATPSPNPFADETVLPAHHPATRTATADGSSEHKHQPSPPVEGVVSDPSPLPTTLAGERSIDRKHSSSTKPPLPSRLVFNPFCSRLHREDAPVIAQLKRIGFVVEESTRQLVVADEAKFNAFVEEFRITNKAPPEWGLQTEKPFRKMVIGQTLVTPSAAVQAFQRMQSTLMRTSASVASLDQQNASNGLAPDTDSDIILNEDQQAVLKLVLEGRNVYLGGSAGTGKSVLLRRLRRELMLRGLAVAMTATTGIAACQIGGTTFHSAMHFTHAGVFVGEAEELLKFNVIVIDEISMMPRSLLEELDRVLRRASGSVLPFGGVQIILCGDFLQLGPVKEANILQCPIFQNHFVHLQLQQQVRQSSGSHFYKQLQTMRKGTCPDDLRDTIMQLPPQTLVGTAVNLLPTNAQVMEANDAELKKLPGAMLTYSPLVLNPVLTVPCTATVILKTEPTFNPASFSHFFVEAMKKAQGVSGSASNIPYGCVSIYRIFDDSFALRVILPTDSYSSSAPETVTSSGTAIHPSAVLDINAIVTERFNAAIAQIDHSVSASYGCHVYEIIADGNGLCTEAVEKVLRKHIEKHPVVQSLSLKIGSRVLLRANLTGTLVNGSIGTVKDFVPCDMENIPNLLRDKVEEVLPAYAQYCKVEQCMDDVLLPVVEFSNGDTIVVPPWKWLVGGSAETDYFGLNAICIPLSLAYAFTVHKVQGLTLYGRVHLELSRMWSCAHLLYVAMSRVKNPEQLSLSAFKDDMITADAHCVEFEEGLPSVHAPRNPIAAHISQWKRLEMGKKMMMHALKDASQKRSGGMLQLTMAKSMKKDAFAEQAVEEEGVALTSQDIVSFQKSINKDTRLKKLTSMTNKTRKILVRTVAKNREAKKSSSEAAKQAKILEQQRPGEA